MHTFMTKIWLREKVKMRSDKKEASTKQCGDNAKSDLNLGDNFKSVTEINGFPTKYFVTDESKSCQKQIRNHILKHSHKTHRSPKV